MNPTPSTALFENAADSLRHGVRHYLNRRREPTAIKHAILNLFHSIELFLKEQLARVHPVLIYRNLDKRVASDSQTVGLAEVVVRLDNVGLPLSSAEVSVLQELQRRRNHIEHHRFDPAADHEAVVGKALYFLLDFLPNHLRARLEDIVADDDAYGEVLAAVLTYRERIERAMAEAAEAGGPLVVCSNCHTRTLAVASLRGRFCFFCRAETEMVLCRICQEYVAPEAFAEEHDMCEECMYADFDVD